MVILNKNGHVNSGFGYVFIILAILILSGCSGETTDDDDTTTSTDCSSDTDIDTVVCAVDEFFTTLTSDELTTVQLDWSDSTAKTVWSNLPGVTRNGLRFGDLDEEAFDAALAVAQAALSDEGYEDLLGIMAADDYLGSLSTGGPGGGPGGDMYSSDNYYIAIFGTPDASNDWMLQIGGHHLAYNITYLSGTGYPVPHHAGVEPKASFEINSTTYAPLAAEGDAMAAMFDALSTTELAAAYLSGESYSDVLMGPDNGSGSLPTDYPTSSGVLVSDLSSDKQALVIAAIAEWVEDYAPDVADVLMNDYTSDTAFAQTYISWAGTESSGVDVDVSGTYMRIDGPRIWVEVACQSGVVISEETHYHTMFRDKTMDYGNSL